MREIEIIEDKFKIPPYQFDILYIDTTDEQGRKFTSSRCDAQNAEIEVPEGGCELRFNFNSGKQAQEPIRLIRKGREEDNAEGQGIQSSKDQEPGNEDSQIESAQDQDPQEVICEGQECERSDDCESGQCEGGFLNEDLGSPFENGPRTNPFE